MESEQEEEHVQEEVRIKEKLEIIDESAWRNILRVSKDGVKKAHRKSKFKLKGAFYRLCEKI